MNEMWRHTRWSAHFEFFFLKFLDIFRRISGEWCWAKGSWIFEFFPIPGLRHRYGECYTHEDRIACCQKWPPEGVGAAPVPKEMQPSRRQPCVNYSFSSLTKCLFIYFIIAATKLRSWLRFSFCARAINRCARVQFQTSRRRQFSPEKKFLWKKKISPKIHFCKFPFNYQVARWAKALKAVIKAPPPGVACRQFHSNYPRTYPLICLFVCFFLKSIFIEILI